MGAAPQLTYRLFLETLAARGILVSLQVKSLGFRSLPVLHIGFVDTASARP